MFTNSAALLKPTPKKETVVKLPWRKQKKPEKVPLSSSKRVSPRTSVHRKREAVRIGSPRWVVPVMLACFLFGMCWIVLYYVAPDAPWVTALGSWNVLIGFAAIVAGFVVSTRWK